MQPVRPPSRTTGRTPESEAIRLKHNSAPEQKGSRLPVTWGDIREQAARCPEGLAQLFHRYMGQPTDEQSGQARVFVTKASFMRHLGLSEDVFRRLISKHDRKVS